MAVDIEKKRERERLWRQNHREYIKDYKRDYYTKHKTAINETKRKYYSLNAHRIRALKQQRRQRHKEQGLCYECNDQATLGSIYCEKHRQATNRKSREQRQKYPERGREQHQNYRERHKQTGLCTECPSKAMAGTDLCKYHYDRVCQYRGEYNVTHIAERRIYQAERRRWFKERRICRGCGTPLIDGEVSRCVTCNWIASYPTVFKRRYFNENLRPSEIAIKP